MAALSIAGPAIRLRPDRMSGLIESVIKAAATLSTALGYRPQFDKSA